MVAMEDKADALQDMMEQQLELQEMKRQGVAPERPVYHHVLMPGPPGTGKSTVARAIADAMSLIGVTKSNKFMRVTPTEIVGTAVGETEERQKELLKQLDGGVLLIDEAHQFDNNAYSRTFFRGLIDKMADPDFQGVIIFAGYPEQLKKLSELDPGFTERVSNVLRFRQYTADEMAEIGYQYIARQKFAFKSQKAKDAWEDAAELISQDPNHASGRSVENMIKYANNARTRRIRGKGLNITEARKFTESDFKNAMEQWRQRDL